MFGMGSILMAIVFYFGFGQTISYIKMFGMFLMLGAGLFLSLDQKSESEDSELSAEEMTRYGYYAIGVACCAPMLWTLQAYFYVKLLTAGRFKPNDLAIDGNIITYIIGSLLHIVYVFGHDYDYSALGLGSVIGVLQVAGMFLMLTSYSTGPAGVVQAMVSMQTVWQTLFDALFLGQLVSSQQIIGMGFGSVSILFLTVGDPIKDACVSKTVDPDKVEKLAQSKEPLIGDSEKQLEHRQVFKQKSVEIEEY